MKGRSFSHYRITGELGQGGMGIVYLAEDTLLGRQVAIKFPTGADSDRGPGEKLLGEARAASALTHPNIAAIYDCGEVDGRPYVVMELVRGKSLAERLQHGPLESAEAAAIVGRVADALGEAHRHGIVHRDIKPSNIALGERGEVKVLDFGLAKRTAPIAWAAGASIAATMTVEAGIAGTPAYMAPEQIRGDDVDARSDLFSLGVVLYECLTGRRPFEGGSTIETLAQVLEQEAAPPSAVNPAVRTALDAVVLKALAKDRAARYGSAEEMLEDLRRAGDSGESARARERRIPRRVWAAAMIPIAALAVLWRWEPAAYEPKAEARRWYEEGVNAIRDGTYYKAAQALAEAVRMDGGFTLAHALLADAWNELDYSDRARQAMLTAMPPGEAPPRVTASGLLQVQAIHRVLTHDYQAAAAGYQELARRLPEAERPNALVDLGRVYEKSENLKSALEAYLEAWRRQPQFAAAVLRAGVVYRRLGEAAKAEESFERAEALYRALSSVEGVTEVLYQRSVLANQSGRFEEARLRLDQAFAMAQASGNAHQRITALLQLSSVYYRQALSDEARRHAMDALELARRHGLDDLTARSLLELGVGAQIRGDAEEAKQRFAEALETAQRFNGRRTEARARFSLASVRVDLGETDAALEDLDRALQFYEGAGYRNEASRCALLAVRAKHKKGDYEGARGAAEAQLDAARRGGDPVQVNTALETLGRIAQDQERYGEALAHYAESRSASRSSGDKVGERWAVAAYGDVAWRLGRYAEARRVLAEAGELGSAGKDSRLLARVEVSRAEMALSESRVGEAAGAARRALALAPGNKELAAEAGRVLGMAEARSGKGGEAARMTGQALAAARATGNSRLMLDALLAHAEALIEAGDAAGAAEAAAEARAAAARSGQRESEWRACVLAGLAARRLSRPELQERSVSAAGALLAQIRQSMSPDEYKTYVARPDIRRDQQRFR